MRLHDLWRVASRFVAVIVALVSCTATYSAEPLKVVPRDESTRVEIRTASPIGRIEWWVPEAVMSEHGVCAIYPTGAKWRQVDGGWEQTIREKKAYGPGNYRDIGGGKIDLVGYELPMDSPVRWTTRLTPGPGRVAFEVRLKNVGTKPIRRAGAAVCVKFLDARWWSDETTFALSDGVATPLSKLGREAGLDTRFEAYLLRGEKFENLFYIKFWGFNRHRLDRAILVSEDRDANVCAVVSGEKAYCMLSNRLNPCTDVMLALGDVEPGKEAVARGTLSIEAGSAREVLGKAAVR